MTLTTFKISQMVKRIKKDKTEFVILKFSDAVR